MGMLPALAACLAWMVSTGLSPAPQEDPVLAEFRQAIRSPDPHVRRDQVERLGRVQSPEAVALLLSRGLTDPDRLVVEAAIRSLAKMEAPEARAAVLEAVDHPREGVREGALLAAGAIPGWPEPPVERVAIRLGEDRSAEVRAAAAEALGLLGSRKATAPLGKALGDRDEAVVIAAADALALLADPPSAAPLLKLLEHPSWRAQVAALHALSKVRVKETIGPIIKYLSEAEGRPRQDARRALVRITQRTFGLNADTWREWWERVPPEWQVPPEKEVSAEDEDPGRGYSRKPTTYHRIPTYSQRIVFVIDVSTSMETPILLKAGRQPDGNSQPPTGTPKIEIAREELAFTLRGLDPETKFNVYAFETDVRRWHKEPVSASPGNVQDAIRWILKQKARRPGGGVVASSGLDSDGRVIGKTNTYGVLREIFGLSSKRGTGGVTPGSGRSPRTRWDTCYFLSDGRPTEGEITDVDTILQEVTAWNKTAKVVIHAIGMEQEQGLVTLLQGLARITGGQCAFVGR